ncbi:MAG: hypothetical protein FWF59_09710 [Turicibacter sp.]|nr:hypothetical protein [Turicibacter sp.]
MKKWYYIFFIAILFFASQTFQEYVMLNGLVYGLLAGIIIAFLAKLFFSVITKTVIFLAILGAIIAFVASMGYLEVPNFLQAIINYFQLFSLTLLLFLNSLLIL